ncbi:Phosphoribosyl-dephospho-CoA transferase [Paraburkholderia hiiakae]|uniref:Phosphoribosyl-dephospho-CoA transferase n=2 Tax=Paraburkholderia hiiakae TaxID=1081782 RepID=A0ABM8P8E2_9BURK|nr:Phosphoribosyl-dephospho-CoA transferase [Paraburkholderia hiiakae]
MLANAPLARHSFVRVSPDAWDACVASQPALAKEPLVRNWAARGWPLIVRRPGPCDVHKIGVPVGLPLPPIAGKQRISTVVPADAIISIERPPELATLRDVAPKAWRATIDMLDLIAQRHHVACRAFGSLAWQGRTGLPYLTGQSDLDLLFDLPATLDVHGALDALLSDIARCAAYAPMRIDGEVIRADGAGANWRELRAAKGEVVVKMATDVVLATVRVFAEG